MRLIQVVFLGKPLHELRDRMVATFALPCLTTQQLPPTKKSSFQPKAATISVLLRWSRGTEANANVPYSQFDLGVIES